MTATESSPLLRPAAPNPSWADYFCILPALFLNIFLSSFENTIAASIQTSLGSSFDAGKNIAWVATSYLIVSTAVQPLYGRFSGLFGRTPVFVFALGTFSIGCLACGLSNNLGQLVAARAFCGLGGGGLITISQIIAYDFVPIKNRGIYQATTNSMYGLGGALGASVGGVIADRLGWHYAFYLQIPLCFFSLVFFVTKGRSRLASLGIQRQKTNLKVKDIDILGSILLMACISTLLLGVNLGGNVLPWSHPLIATFFATTLLIALVFIRHEKSFPLPVLPLTFFHGREMLSHLVSNFFCAMGILSIFYLLPTYFQVVLRNSVAQASARLIYPTVSAPIGSIITGALLRTIGKRMTQPLVKFGALILALGTVLNLVMQYESARGRSEIWYAAHISWTNLGMGIFFPASLIHISAKPTLDQGITTSLLFLTRSLGSVFGISISQSILQNVLAKRLIEALPKHAEKVIDMVRNDVDSINRLPAPLQNTVIECYADALRAAFVFCVACGSLSFIAIMFAPSTTDEDEEQNGIQNP
ncbi:MFS general substrate transporter [Cylindrobasidium torrendii FP15055 ss-10]|uniref:MFS general substrate transporter n=1 Tax=Cylindrobasidium torrendii FP15055 ss-10 TaxID=1314674 RepID=A0A0D7BC00_9AGAR|nr:MFS general substrate transporter [Cylindrobasidium torrendii FP15055 ss-10]